MTLSSHHLIHAIQAENLELDNQHPLVVHEEDFRNAYIPLARRIAEEPIPEGSRLMIAIAGPPGSGNSVSATFLARLLTLLYPSGDVLHLPIDGFHHTSSDLRERSAIASDSQEHTWEELKGCPFTFNTDELLEKLKKLALGEPLWWPSYDRDDKHDIIEESVQVPDTCRVVLLEGTYLLFHEPPWHEIRRLFHITIFQDTPLWVCRYQVYDRHVRGGRDKSSARWKTHWVDEPNMHAVAESAGNAQYLLKGGTGRYRLFVQATA